MINTNIKYSPHCIWKLNSKSCYYIRQLIKIFLKKANWCSTSFQQTILVAELIKEKKTNKTIPFKSTCNIFFPFHFIDTKTHRQSQRHFNTATYTMRYSFTFILMNCENLQIFFYYLPYTNSHWNHSNGQPRRRNWLSRREIDWYTYKETLGKRRTRISKGTRFKFLYETEGKTLFADRIMVRSEMLGWVPQRGLQKVPEYERCKCTSLLNLVVIPRQK